MLYDPSRVVVEFFVGGGSTTYFDDTRHVHRMFVDSAFSKVQMKRAHRSPYKSGRYALEWHGRQEPMEVPFPLYMDPRCLVAVVQEDSLILPRGSAVPQLERTSNIENMLFIRSTSEPSTDENLRIFLSDLVPRDRLTELVDRMSGAYALRRERGAERPYQGVRLFHG